MCVSWRRIAIVWCTRLKNQLRASALNVDSSQQLASCLGLIPGEDSSGGWQRQGHLTKRANALLRGLLVESRAQCSVARRTVATSPTGALILAGFMSESSHR